MTTSKLRNNGKWTEGRFRGFITSALRYASRKWPPKFEAIKQSYTSTRRGKSGRLAKHFRCAGCGGEFVQKHIQVDHIEPIGKSLSWDEYIEKLFCEAINLQVLCLKCHKIKTKKEKLENN